MRSFIIGRPALHQPLVYYGYQIKADEMGRACNKTNSYNSARKYDAKRPHGRPRCRWENNIKMDLGA
jgi:hypothetical protein